MVTGTVQYSVLVGIGTGTYLPVLVVVVVLDPNIDPFIWISHFAGRENSR
jgi:hypothetical protein